MARFGPDPGDEERWSRRDKRRGADRTPKHTGWPDWMKALDRNGLDVDTEAIVEGAVAPRLLVKGRIKGCHVEAARMSATGPSHRWRLTARRDGMPPGLTLRAETTGTTMKKLFLGEDVQTGDEAFDQLASLRGPEAVCVALMTGGVREALTGWFERGAAAAEGAVRCELLLGPEASGLRAWLGRLAMLCNDLRLAPAKIATRLLANARNDPHSGVRLRNLELVAALAPKRIRRHAPQLLADTDARVRVQAALAVGTRGVPTLIQACATPESLESASLAAAIEALGRLASAAEASLERYPEPVLLALLDESRFGDLHLSVVRSLALRGTERAQPRLVELSRGFFTRGPLKLAAKIALRQIAEREGPTDRGRLSLAESAESGQLALSQERTSGSLSEPET